jgi:AcrR family transcriptional regulator
MSANPDLTDKKSARRSNEDRTDATKRALVAAARKLFVERGYANTATPDIVAAAGVTRGALYHHFADKSELFFIVAKNMAEEVAQSVSEKSKKSIGALNSLGDGAKGYFAAMAEDGRARVLLLDAPSALSPGQCAELSQLSGEKELEDGLRAAMAADHDKKVPYAELAALVSAAFDRAALAIANGAPPKTYIAAMNLLLARLARQAQ